MMEHQTITIKEHFDVRLNDMRGEFASRLDRLERNNEQDFADVKEALEKLVDRDTNTRLELTKYGGFSAIVSAATAALMQYLSRQ